MTGPTKTEIDFPTIHRRDYVWSKPTDRISIDPKESTEIYSEFVIKSDVEVVNVYTSLTLDGRAKGDGWDINTYHEIGSVTASSTGASKN